MAGLGLWWASGLSSWSASQYLRGRSASGREVRSRHVSAPDWRTPTTATLLPRRAWALCTELEMLPLSLNLTVPTTLFV